MGYILLIIALLESYVITSFPKKYYPNLIWKFELDSSLHNILLTHPTLFIILIITLLTILIIFLIVVIIKKLDQKLKRVLIFWSLILIVINLAALFFVKNLEFNIFTALGVL